VFNSGNLIRYTHAASGLWVQFDPQSLNWRNQDNSQHQIAIKQAVAAVVEDDVLRWPAAWGTGRHFQFQCQTGRLQKLLTVDSAANLPTPTVTGDIVLELEYSLSIATGLSFWIDGVEWTRANGVRVTTGNHIECRNAQGETLFWIAPPRAWDSNGSETGGLLQVHRNGGPSALFINVRIPRAWIQTAVFPIFVDPTIDAQVGASADDANENITGTVSITSTTPIMSNSNTEGHYIGFRFQSVSVPKGATIDTAYISLNFNSTSYDDVHHNIDCEAVDNSSAFSTTTNDISGRTLTGNAVSWSAVGVGTGFVNSPGLAVPVKAVTDRSGWASGNSLNVIMTYPGSGTYLMRIIFWDSSSTNAPKLHIEYTEGGGETLSITIDPTTTTKSGVRIWG
jgi:hypothetical protein